MRRRWTMAFALAVALAVGGVGGAHWAHSQAGIREGAFVVAQDGSRWVVGGGQRYRIDWTFDDTDAVPGLREGRAVATVCEATAALGGADPDAACTPAQPARAPVAAAPADDGVLLDVRGGYTFFTSGPDRVDATTVRTASFTLEHTRDVQLCWEMADPEPNLVQLMAFVWERRPGGDTTTPLYVLEHGGTGCWSMPKRLAPGTYYFQVSSSFHSWRLVLRAV